MGNWRWACASPIWSDPEGSSHNEIFMGYCPVSFAHYYYIVYCNTMNKDINKNPKSEQAYQVLARKYRPHRFEDMIGHGAMVQTLENAFKTGRIAQAYILTGVRGIGKTTTARILARALNYQSQDGKINKPTTALTDLGIHCQDIIDSRHIDVFEMDAASRTGIGDIREIIEQVRYKPVSARYKVYIIDEVHMLSKAAFNGLLKTLEEPPEHVKFIFATTEIQKIPVTVLSRCQRFDLKRIDAEQLKDLFKKIAAQENVSVTDDALAIIAQAAEGSARDGLSILDQAIAMGDGNVVADDVRRMLGIADRMRLFTLFENLLNAELPEALAEFKNQYDEGADPARILSELAEITHWVTRLKIIPNLQDNIWSEEAHKKGNELANKLSMRSLAKTWQMLLKGMEEVKNAPKVFAAAEMALIRLSYGSQLPNPDDVIKKLMAQNQANKSQPPTVSSSMSARPNSTAPNTNAQSSLNISTNTDNNAPTNLLNFPSNGATALQVSPEIETAPPPPNVDNVIAFSSQDETEFYANDTDNDNNNEANNYIYSPKSFEELANLLGKQRELLLRREIMDNVLLISYKIGEIYLKPLPKSSSDTPKILVGLLQEWTGEKWQITFNVKAPNAAQLTLRQQELAKFNEKASKFAQEDIIKHTLEQFEGSLISKIIDLKNYKD